MDGRDPGRAGQQDKDANSLLSGAVMGVLALFCAVAFAVATQVSG